LAAGIAITWQMFRWRHNPVEHGYEHADLSQFFGQLIEDAKQLKDGVKVDEGIMTKGKTIGYVALSLLAMGVLLNAKDIARYIRISSM
jgi:hypothetical protein